jgi:hypothetical protein
MKVTIKLVFLAFVLFSCKPAPVARPPGYPFTATAHRLFFEISSLAKRTDGLNSAAVEFGNIKENFIKEGYLKELYISHVKTQNLAPDWLDVSILALIRDSKYNYEIWQVYPFKERVAFIPNKSSKMEHYLSAPFPFPNE